MRNLTWESGQLGFVFVVIINSLIKLLKHPQQRSIMTPLNKERQ